MQHLTARQAVRRSLELLSARDRRLLAAAAVLSMATSALDIVGVLLLGVVGAYGAASLGDSMPPATLGKVASSLGIQGASTRGLLITAAATAAAFLLLKSVLAVYINKRILTFLANRQTELSCRLTRAALAQQLLEIQSRSSQATTYALTDGVTIATISMLSSAVVGVSELAMLTAMGLTLFLINPLITLAALAFFGGLFALLQIALGRRVAAAGIVGAAAAVQSRTLLQDALGTFREILVLDRREHFAEQITEYRRQNANAMAETAFVNQLPKYVLEAAMVIGALGLAAALFLTQGPAQAVGTVALFLASATRILPSILRLQQATLNLRNAAGGAHPLYELVDELRLKGALQAGQVSLLLRTDDKELPFSGDLRAENVSVTYPGARIPALVNVSFHVEQGAHVALVGPSGAGKSTMADVIMGAVHPDSGTIKIGGQTPLAAIAAWPGSVAYVPQRVYLTEGSIRSNIALGLMLGDIEDEAVWDALKRVELAAFVEASTQGLDTLVGEGGARLSGGQRQRLGLARALYSKPRVLLLDEATSSLDTETEFAITQALGKLRGDVTIFVIAHRLSTVVRCDTVMFLSEGRLIASGSFEDVRAAVPSLERQAQLSGL